MKDYGNKGQTGYKGRPDNQDANFQTKQLDEAWFAERERLAKEERYARKNGTMNEDSSVTHEGETGPKKKKRKRRKKLRLVEPDTNLSVDERQDIRKKRRHRRRRRFLIILAAILIAASVTGVLTFMDRKGYANIEKIMVEGNSHYTVAQILEYSGAETGQKLISAKTSKMENRLEALPYIKTANVSKSLFHTLKIKVEERIPTYALYYGGGYVYVDEEFMMLDKLNESSGLPVIEGFVPVDGEMGQIFKPKDQTHFNQAVEVADALMNKGLNFVKVTYKNSLIRIYFSQNMVCEGTNKNLLKYMGELNEIIYNLTTQKVERATIYIGDNGYISFSPKIE